MNQTISSTLVMCSGGLDSVVLAYREHRDGHLVGLLSFDYGQRHRKELEYAARTAADLGVGHRIVDISTLTESLRGCALTDDIEVPEGHYADPSMSVTVVPNRNAVMLGLAVAVAAGTGAAKVSAAFHAGDAAVYPDCRIAFMDAFRAMERLALGDLWAVQIDTPFIRHTKADIAAQAKALGVPVERTWSCYKGGERHCGRCGTCVERMEALNSAGVYDPTEYEDVSYWREAVQHVE